MAKAKTLSQENAETRKSNDEFAARAKSDAEVHLAPVANIDDVADDLVAGEWIKKEPVTEMGPFNIIGATRRQNTYRNKTTEQIVFELQFLGDENNDIRGVTAMMSMDTNTVREKYYAVVKKRGGVGPLILKQLPTTSADSTGAFVFEKYIAPAIDPTRGTEGNDHLPT